MAYEDRPRGFNLHGDESVTSRQDRRGAWMSAADLTLELARSLPPGQRRLVRAVIEHGQPIASLAEIMGISRGRLQRRLDALLARLRHPRFIAARRHWARLTPRERRLARAWVFHGVSQRGLAARFEVSLFAIRRWIAALTSKLRRLEKDWRSQPGDTSIT
ncbi:MAG: hypothetical protein BIFFINMI_02934 [Phycisphaerae bacterium]|nr:hypothetical protein [Phycisphaerae bacterium]